MEVYFSREITTWGKKLETSSPCAIRASNRLRASTFSESKLLSRRGAMLTSSGSSYKCASVPIRNTKLDALLRLSAVAPNCGNIPSCSIKAGGDWRSGFPPWRWEDRKRVSSPAWSGTTRMEFYSIFSAQTKLDKRLILIVNLYFL